MAVLEQYSSRSTGQDGRPEGQIRRNGIVGRAEDLCTACTPAMLTHPTPTDTPSRTLPIIASDTVVTRAVLHAPAALQSHLPDAYI